MSKYLQSIEDDRRARSRMEAFDNEADSDQVSVGRDDQEDDDDYSASDAENAQPSVSKKYYSASSDDSGDASSDAGAEDDETVLRAKIAEVPFGQLIEIQQRMGLKKFAQLTVRGKRGEASLGAQSRVTRPAKRESKHRPTEISAKKPVSRRRIVIEHAVVTTNPVVRRDPRFDSLSGKLNIDLHQKAYSFLDEYRTKEIAELKQCLTKEKDERERAKLARVIQQMESKEMARKNTDRKQQLKRRLRKEEAEKIKDGKKPFYVKRAEFKKLELMEKYEALGKKNAEKSLEKRRRRNAAKEHKRMPNKRPRVEEP